MWKAAVDFFSLEWLFQTKEMCASIQQAQAALRQLAIKAAKECGGFVVTYDVRDLTLKECEVLVDIIKSDRLHIRVEKP